MTDKKIQSGDDVISRESPEYRELLTTMRRATSVAEKLIAKVRPCLLDERYFTTEQLIYQQTGLAELPRQRDNSIYLHRKHNPISGVET